MALVALIAGLLACAGPAGATVQAPPLRSAGVAETKHACAAASPREASCFALVRIRSAGSSGGALAAPSVARKNALSLGPAGGLTPALLASVYEYTPESGGSGQTIGIVDAYDDPNIESDLATFDTKYGLPECTAADGCLKKVGQTGSTKELPTADTSGWSIEISLDVETAHAACPKCKILLVEAQSPLLSDLAAAVDEAVALGATEVSNGYGAPEEALTAAERAAYNHPSVPILAATGDEGYYGWTSVNLHIRGPEMPYAPASLPTVVAVGGTSLTVTEGGARATETVWNENGSPDEFLGLAALGATGGGCSKLFTAQPWQAGVAGFAATGCGDKRLAADVSAIANPSTGFDIFDSYMCGKGCEFPRVDGGWATFGGTSLSTPLIAGLYALAGGGHGLAYPSVTLYGREADSKSLFDVVSGGNGLCGGALPALCGEPNRILGAQVDCEGTTACDAALGFDGPSGVGTPKGLGLFKPQDPTAVISVRASQSAGAPVEFDGRSSTDAYPGVQLTRYVWSWGDGTSSEGPNPSHVYASPGIYSVELTVTDELGLTGTSKIPVGIAVRPGIPPIVVVQTAQPSASQPPGTPPSTTEPTPTVNVKTGQLSLPSSSITVQANGTALVKLRCTGSVGCHGKVTLRAKRVVKVKGKRRSVNVTIGTATFTIASGHSATIKIKLSGVGRGLLSAAHDKLSGRLSLAGNDDTLPLEQVTSVHLLEQRSTHK